MSKPDYGLECWTPGMHYKMKAKATPEEWMAFVARVNKAHDSIFGFEMTAKKIKWDKSQRKDIKKASP